MNGREGHLTVPRLLRLGVRLARSGRAGDRGGLGALDAGLRLGGVRMIGAGKIAGRERNARGGVVLARRGSGRNVGLGIGHYVLLLRTIWSVRTNGSPLVPAVMTDRHA